MYPILGYWILRICSSKKNKNGQIKWNSSKSITFQNITCGFIRSSVGNVEIEEVKAYLTANPVFKERERERWFCILPTQMMLEDAYSLAERQCLPQIKNKSFQKSSIFRANGFLPFSGDALPPLVNAIIRGSEDGAENIPPAPAFRPINCISPKCWGKYFHHKSFTSICFLLGLTVCLKKKKKKKRYGNS